MKCSECGRDDAHYIWATVVFTVAVMVMVLIAYQFTLTAFVKEYDDDEFRDVWLLGANMFGGLVVAIMGTLWWTKKRD